MTYHPFIILFILNKINEIMKMLLIFFQFYLIKNILKFLLNKLFFKFY